MWREAEEKQMEARKEKEIKNLVNMFSSIIAVMLSTSNIYQQNGLMGLWHPEDLNLGDSRSFPYILKTDSNKTNKYIWILLVTFSGSFLPFISVKRARDSSQLISNCLHDGFQFVCFPLNCVTIITLKWDSFIISTSKD